MRYQDLGEHEVAEEPLQLYVAHRQAISAYFLWERLCVRITVGSYAQAISKLNCSPRPQKILAFLYDTVIWKSTWNVSFLTNFTWNLFRRGLRVFFSQNRLKNWLRFLLIRIKNNLSIHLNKPYLERLIKPYACVT